MKIDDTFKDEYVCVKTFSDGVHFGYLKEYCSQTRHAVLHETRRLWSWKGAFTLSQVCNSGFKESGEMSEVADKILLPEVVEILPVKAVDFIKSYLPYVPVVD